MVFSDNAAMLFDEGGGKLGRSDPALLSSRGRSLDRDTCRARDVWRISWGIDPIHLAKLCASREIEGAVLSNRFRPDQGHPSARNTLVEAIRLPICDKVTDPRGIAPVGKRGRQVL